METLSVDLEFNDSNEFEDELEKDSEDYVIIINTNCKLVLEQTRRVLNCLERVQKRIVCYKNMYWPNIIRQLLLKNSIKKNLIDL